MPGGLNVHNAGGSAAGDVPRYRQVAGTRHHPIHLTLPPVAASA
jgi:hypothetical protein